MGALVFVQADAVAEDGLKEAAWVASLAQDDQRIQDIVAYAPLHNPSTIRPYLDELVTIPAELTVW